MRAHSTNPAPREEAGPPRRERLNIFIVLVGVVSAHFGVWNATIPFGDEGSHVFQSFAILKGASSTDLYQLSYVALLSHVTPDPVVAHLILRSVVSIFSAVGLYLVLRSFSGIRSAAVVISCLAWAGGALCTPLMHGASNSIFSLALMLPALAWLLRKPSLNSSLFFILSSLWTAQARSEYFAPLVLVSAWGAFLIYLRKRTLKTRASPIRPITSIGTVVLVTAIAISILVVHTKRRTAEISYDSYLLLGLGQCYADRYRRLHPDEPFDPMTEYKPVLNKVFGTPKGFREAIANNPTEAVHYFLVNSIRNLSKIPRQLLSSKTKAYSGLILFVLLIGSTLGIRELISTGSWRSFYHGVVLRDLMPLLLFASASWCAIILLVPLGRYWVSWVPLIYLWLAWAIDRLINRWQRVLRESVLLAIAVVVFGFPVFIGQRSNKEMIYAVRDSMINLPRKPVVAGDFVIPWVAWAFKGEGIAINANNGLDVEDLRKDYYDVFVADSLDGTRLWSTNRSFFRTFVSYPGRLGYRLLPDGLAFGSHVYVRTQQ